MRHQVPHVALSLRLKEQNLTHLCICKLYCPQGKQEVKCIVSWNTLIFYIDLLNIPKKNSPYNKWRPWVSGFLLDERSRQITWPTFSEVYSTLSTSNNKKSS